LLKFLYSVRKHMKDVTLSNLASLNEIGNVDLDDEEENDYIDRIVGCLPNTQSLTLEGASCNESVPSLTALLLRIMGQLVHLQKLSIYACLSGADNMEDICQWLQHTQSLQALSFNLDYQDNINVNNDTISI